MPAAKSSPTPVTPDATAPDVHSPVAPEPPEHKDMYSTPPAQDDQVCIILKIVICLFRFTAVFTTANHCFGSYYMLARCFMLNWSPTSPVYLNPSSDMF